MRARCDTDFGLVGVGAAVLLGLVANAAGGPSLKDIAPYKPTRVVNTSHFGTKSDRLNLVGGKLVRATQWRVGQVSSLRLWGSDTDWQGVEAQRGRFDFSRLDSGTGHVRHYGLGYLKPSQTATCGWLRALRPETKIKR